MQIWLKRAEYLVNQGLKEVSRDQPVSADGGSAVTCVGWHILILIILGIWLLATDLVARYWDGCKSTVQDAAFDANWLAMVLIISFSSEW